MVLNPLFETFKVAKKLLLDLFGRGLLPVTYYNHRARIERMKLGLRVADAFTTEAALELKHFHSKIIHHLALFAAIQSCPIQNDTERSL